MDTQPQTNRVDPQAGQEATRCHLVQIVGDKRGRIETIRCDSLDQETLTRIRDAAALWRDADAVVRRLNRMRAQRGVGPLALCFQPAGKGRLAIPPPLRVPFEPLELDEARAPLADLLETTHAPEPSPASPRWRRTIIRLGVPLAILLGQLPNAIAQIAVHHDFWMTSFWALFLGSLAIAAAIAWALSDQWFIVPGGVVVRKTLVGRVGQTLWRYTPADTTLIVRPHEHSTWRSELWRDRKPKKRRTTPLEVAALLAAWRSPLEPPAEERLTDLR